MDETCYNSYKRGKDITTVAQDTSMNRSDFIEALQQSVDQFNEIRKKHGAKVNDLSGGDFSGCDLRGAQLGRMLLRNCRFDDADLTDANLSHSDVTGASFKGALIDNVNLHKAILTGADLCGAILGGFDRDGRMCLNVENFRDVKWGRPELSTIMNLLNQNNDWEILYDIVPRNHQSKTISDSSS